jgi:O-antigen ligase
MAAIENNTQNASNPSLFHKLGLGFLCLALFLAPLVGGSPAGQKYQADSFLAVLRLLVFLGSLFLLPKQLNKTLWPFLGVVVLSIISLIAHFKGDVLLFAMLPAMLDWCAFAMLIWVVSQRSESEKTIIRGAILAGFGINALAVIFQALTMPEGGQRPTGLFFSPNFSAGFTALCLPIVLGELLRAKQTIAQVGWGILLLIGAGAVVAPASRVTPLIAVGGMVLTVLIIVVIGRQKLPVKSLVIAAIALLIGAGVMSRNLSTRSQDGKGNENSTAFRVETWKGTLKQATQNPLLGTGPGTYQYKYPQYAIVAKTDLAHSSPLQVAAEMGFPALILLFVGIFWAMGTALLGLRNTKGVDVSRIIPVAAGMGALAVGLLRGLFDSEWSLLGNALPFFAVLGMLLTPLSPSREAGLLGGKGGCPPEGKGGDRGLKNGMGAAILPVIGGILTILGLQNIWPPVPPKDNPQEAALLSSEVRKARWQEAARLEPGPRTLIPLARLAEREEKLDEAIALMREASKYDPNDVQTLSILATMQEKAKQNENALQTWKKLAEIYEGPAGKIRAISEQPEVYPAFAYERLGEWDKAATIVENYAAMPPVYVESEIGITLGTASTPEEKKGRLNNLLGRRQKLREMYVGILPKTSSEHQGRQTGVLEQLDKVTTQITTLIESLSTGTNAVQ